MRFLIPKLNGLDYIEGDSELANAIQIQSVTSKNLRLALVSAFYQQIK